MAYTQNDVAAITRDGALTLLWGIPATTVGALFGGPIGAAVAIAATASTAAAIAAIEAQVQKTELSQFGGGIGKADSHSQALLVLLKWAQDNATTDWQAASPYFLALTSSETIANAIPEAGNRKGRASATPGYVLQTAIAYSALEAGGNNTLVFGDTGIRALFNDASDLGVALRVGGSAALQKSAGTLAQMLVEYAGKLAIGEVTQAGDSNAAEGILKSNPGDDTLTVDLSKSTWAKGATSTAIVGRSDLINTALATINYTPPAASGAAPVAIPENDLRAGLAWLYNSKIQNGYVASDPTAIIDLITFQTTNTAFVGTLIDRPDPNPKTDGVGLFVAGDGNDNITGTATDDFIYGGNGSDFIRGGAGSDLVAGGAGDDVLSGGTGNDFIDGGDGQDTYDLRFETAVTNAGLNATLGLARPAAGSGDPITGTLSLFDAKGAQIEENRFVDVEAVRLSNNADKLTILAPDFSDYASGNADLVVDMGNRTGGNASAADFDTVNYAPRTGFAGQEGTFWYNGSTHGAGPIAGAITTALSYLPGPLGLIGLRAGMLLESALPDDDLVVKGAENINLTSQNDRFAFTNNDYSVHSGYGKLDAGAGDDILLYDDGKFVKAGTRGATEDLQLTLDGGTGNDWIYASGGDKVITAGGLGKDWIYNSSAGGVIWGDVKDSYKGVDGNRYYNTHVTGADGNPVTVQNLIADDKTNSDNFWWSGDTTIMDAGHSDVLKFFGIALVGGDVGGGIVLGSLGFGAVGALAGKAQAGNSPENSLYFDNILPFITYSFESVDGHLDMKVGNVFAQLWDGLFDSAPNPNAGVMRIKNVDAY